MWYGFSSSCLLLSSSSSNLLSFDSCYCLLPHVRTCPLLLQSLYHKQSFSDHRSFFSTTFLIRAQVFTHHYCATVNYSPDQHHRGRCPISTLFYSVSQMQRIPCVTDQLTSGIHRLNYQRLYKQSSDAFQLKPYLRNA